MERLTTLQVAEPGRWATEMVKQSWDRYAVLRRMKETMDGFFLSVLLLFFDPKVVATTHGAESGDSEPSTLPISTGVGHEAEWPTTVGASELHAESSFLTSTRAKLSCARLRQARPQTCV